MSNYERGVTILDIKDPSSPQEIAFFDTYSASDNASFNGNWGVYPYLPSGIILASDIQGGLFILQDETLSAESNAVGFAHSSQTIDEDGSSQVEVRRQGSGAISVDYTVLYLSATQEDLGLVSGTLEWQTNEQNSQFITLEQIDDGIDEFDEIFAITLNNAKGGDIINEQSIAFVTIAGTAVNTGVLGFGATEVTALETQGRISIEVQRTGGSEQAIRAELSVRDISTTISEDYTVNDGTAAFLLNWEAGDDDSQFVEIDIINDALSESSEQFRLTLSTEDQAWLGDVRETLITILDDESNNPPSVTLGSDFQVNTRQTLRFQNAQVSDDSDGFSLLWSQSSGSSVTIDDATTLTPTLTFSSTPGDVTLQLSVTDIFGVQASDSVEIKVIAPQAQVPPSAESSSGGSLQYVSLLMLLLVLQCRTIVARQRSMN
jgi:hypothetical protein